MRSALMLFILVNCFMALFLVAGCERNTTSREPSDVSHLRRQWWNLQCLGVVGEEIPLAPETSITVLFRDDGICEGSGGCNGYWGYYEVADNNRVTIDVEAITDAVCGTPDGVMEQEYRFINALHEVYAFEIGDDTLKLFYAGGLENLIFARLKSRR